MSYLSDNIFSLLKEVFPFAKIEKEYYIVYKNQKLFVDFYLPSYLIAIEVHGAQHDHFVEHFHQDNAGWVSHKKRDKLKEEWAIMNNITFVTIREKEAPKTKQEMMLLIERCTHV